MKQFKGKRGPRTVRPESIVGAASIRTWPVVAEDENGQAVLVEVIERWDPETRRWVSTGDWRKTFQGGQDQDLWLVRDAEGRGSLRWRKVLGRWWRDSGTDPGRGWRDRLGKGGRDQKAAA